MAAAQMQVYPNNNVGDFAPPIDVSVVTPLLPFFKLSDRLSVICITVINLGAQDGTVQLDFSEDGIHVDALSGPGQSQPLVYPVPAGKQASVEIGPNRMRRYIRLEGQTTDPDFPVTSMQVRISGLFHP